MTSINLPPEPWADGQIHPTPNGDLVYVVGKGWQAVDGEGVAVHIASAPAHFAKQIGIDEDPAAIGAATVGDALNVLAERTDVDGLTGLVNDAVASISGTTEIFSNVSGTITPASTDRAIIDVASTAAAWSLNLANMPQDRPASLWVKIDSSGSHTPTFPANVVWDGGSAPSGSLWAAGKRAVIQFTRVPFTNLIEGRLVVGDDTPPIDDIPPVDPVTPTYQYSTSSNRSDVRPLGPSGATNVEMLDPFTGTNGAAWSSTYWTEYRESHPTCSYTIQSNKGRLLAGGAAYAFNSIQANIDFVADGEISGTITPDSDAEAYHGITFRDNGNGSGYTVEFALPSETVKLFRQESFVNTEIASQTVTAIGDAVSLSFRISFDGPALKVKVWATSGAEPGSWTIEASDSRYVTGKTYLFAANGAAGTSRHADYDNFQIESKTSTLPAGQVAIVIGPLSTNIAYVDIWHDHSGGLPAVGSEATVDSYVGRRSVFPYDFLGGTTSAAVMWDTRFDPTGNSRAGYNPAGSNTITVRYTYVDDTTSTGTVTFNTGNPTASPDPYVATYGSSAVVGINPSVNVTVPSASNRTVIAVALYQAVFDVTGATLGGNAMTVIDSTWNASSTNGIIALRINEAQMPAAGTRSLALQHSGSEGANTLTHIHYWVFSGAPTPSITATAPVIRGAAGLMDVALSVPASTTVLTVAGHVATTASLTNDWDGTAETQLVTDAVYDLNSQAEWKQNAGAAGTKAVRWSASGNWGRAIMIAFASDVISEPPPEPITPGTPTITTPTNPGDNQLRTTWTATSNAVAYEGRIGTTNPPTTTPISLGNVTNWTRSGLAPSTQYWIQVRAVSSTNTRSNWSNVVTGTTNASDTVVAPISPTRLIYGKYADLRHITATYGPSHRTDGVLVPNWWAHQNFGPLWSNVWSAARVGSQAYNIAQNVWTQNAANRPAAMTAIGQRCMITTRLAKDGHPKNGSQPSNAELAALDMARSGSRGDDHRRAEWTKFAQDLAGWPGQVFVGLSHESNGSWYSNYSGVNPNLVGSTALASVPNSQFGSAMGAALREVAVDGNLATVHRLAYEAAAEVLWAANPNLILCYTLTANADSAPPGDQPIAGLSSAWQPAAHPAPEFVDVHSFTLYCRGAGRPLRKSGTNNPDLLDSWNFQNQGLNSNWVTLAASRNRPAALWEVGANWDVFDWPPTYTNGPSDDQSSIWWKKNQADFPQIDMAFITYWHAGGDRTVGSTYQLPEANYGYQKTSGTTRMFPKTTTTLRGIYF
jgi:hypothetical protein